MVAHSYKAQIDPAGPGDLVIGPKRAIWETTHRPTRRGGVKHPIPADARESRECESVGAAATGHQARDTTQPPSPIPLGGMRRLIQVYASAKKLAVSAVY